MGGRSRRSPSPDVAAAARYPVVTPTATAQGPAGGTGLALAQCVNRTTQYLGLTLPSPLVVAANPLTERLDAIRAMEDAGAGAVVLLSLFEEQLTLTRAELTARLAEGAGGLARAQVRTPDGGRLKMGPLGYLEHIEAAKAAVDIPIVASLNGTPGHTWADYAQLVELAGADAIELNLYIVPTDPTQSPAEIEQTYYDAVRAVRRAVAIPVAVKLTPFFSNLTYSALRFCEAGADGLVMFNRFYQPTVDLERKVVRPQLSLSNSDDIVLPMRWTSILRDHVQASLSASSGVHSAHDALKLIAVGADTVQLCSVLLQHGIEHLRTIQRGMDAWLQAHDTTLNALRGTLSARSGSATGAFERAQYLRTLDSYTTPGHTPPPVDSRSTLG